MAHPGADFLMHVLQESIYWERDGGGGEEMEDDDLLNEVNVRGHCSAKRALHCSAKHFRQFQFILLMLKFDIASTYTPIL